MGVTASAAQASAAQAGASRDLRRGEAAHRGTRDHVVGSLLPLDHVVGSLLPRRHSSPQPVSSTRVPLWPQFPYPLEALGFDGDEPGTSASLPDGPGSHTPEAAALPQDSSLVSSSGCVCVGGGSVAVSAGEAVTAAPFLGQDVRA